MDVKYNWKDILIIGEYKKTGGYLKHDLVQLSGFIRKIFVI